MTARYFCTHGSYSEYDRKRCQPCKQRAQAVTQGPLQACADCVGYTPQKTLIRKSDGREICAGCQRKIETLARDRAQLGFFDQRGLF